MIEDMSNPNRLSAYISESKIIKRCPTCTSDYKEKHIKVIEQHVDMAVVHITCASCTQAVIAVLGYTHLGVGLIGLATDLNLEDTKRLHRTDSFSEEDLLEAAQMLRTKHFNTLFNHS